MHRRKPYTWSFMSRRLIIFWRRTLKTLSIVNGVKRYLTQVHLRPSKNTPEFELERSQFLTMHCGTECSLTNLYESMVPHFGGARWGIVSTPCVACQRRSSLQYSKNSYSVF